MMNRYAKGSIPIQQNHIKSPQNRKMKKTLCVLIIVAHLMSLFLVPTKSLAQSMLDLPKPGKRVPMSDEFSPVTLFGLKMHANPFKFDFILNTGDTGLGPDNVRIEAEKLIKYFMTALTVPEEDIWVNLSPHEDHRVTSAPLSRTALGRDLLAQDYILKQVTSSSLYPEEELGESFWSRVFKKAHETLGITNIPVNTFNKIWIVPEKAVVYLNKDRVFVIDSHLKVLLEEDYLALRQSQVGNGSLGMVTGAREEAEDEAMKGNRSNPENLTSDMIREMILPEIEKEVNEGRNFTKLRQICHSLILAAWYKANLKKALVNRVYSDQRKIDGVDIKDKEISQKIYNRYLDAYKKGVYDYVKEDYDAYAQDIVPRKYFSGGFSTVLNDQGIVKRIQTVERLSADQKRIFTGSPQKILIVESIFGKLMGKKAGTDKGKDTKDGNAVFAEKVEQLVKEFQWGDAVAKKFKETIQKETSFDPAEIEGKTLRQKIETIARVIKGDLGIEYMPGIIDAAKRERGTDLEEIIKTRQAVCGGFTLFFTILGMAAGIENIGSYGVWDESTANEGHIMSIVRHRITGEAVIADLATNDIPIISEKFPFNEVYPGRSVEKTEVQNIEGQDQNVDKVFLTKEGTRKIDFNGIAPSDGIDLNERYYLIRKDDFFHINRQAIRDAYQSEQDAIAKIFQEGIDFFSQGSTATDPVLQEKAFESAAEKFELTATLYNELLEKTRANEALLSTYVSADSVVQGLKKSYESALENRKNALANVEIIRNNHERKQRETRNVQRVEDLNQILREIMNILNNPEGQIADYERVPDLVDEVMRSFDFNIVQNPDKVRSDLNKYKEIAAQNISRVQYSNLRMQITNAFNNGVNEFNEAVGHFNQQQRERASPLFQNAKSRFLEVEQLVESLITDIRQESNRYLAFLEQSQLQQEEFDLENIKSQAQDILQKINQLEPAVITNAANNVMRLKQAIGEENSENVGGIDWNTKFTQFELRGKTIDFSLSKEWEDISLDEIDGLVPFIIRIVPAGNAFNIVNSGSELTQAN
jgi:ribosomal protein L21E